MSRQKKAAKPPKAGLVIDSSISIAWCFPDEQDEYSQIVLDALASEQAHVPDLWHHEVANTLIVGERRKRSTQANTVTWLGFLSSLPIAVDDETKAHAFGNALSLARDHNLSAYDAAYLELALRRGLPLATLDDKLKAAAQAGGVPLYGVNQAGDSGTRLRRGCSRGPLRSPPFGTRFAALPPAGAGRRRAIVAPASCWHANR